ncbi:MAG: arginine--tRNA ligase [Planctomycetes bacterium]|nr:arginine--tRNA ligase [Planctomycetota bacterium]
MPNVRRLLEHRVTEAMRTACPEAAAPAIVVSAQDARFGDYQANGAMALAKQLRRKPRDVAAEILARLDVSDLSEPPEIAGPGFLNFRLRPQWVSGQLGKVNADEPHLGAEPAARPETVVVDYSAPNLAKEMHVGHLRSTIIGDALVRMLEFAGHTVVRQNHVGDWGTQFGMLIAHFLSETSGMDERTDVITSRRGAFIRDMEEFYRQAKRRFDEDPDFASDARGFVVRLQRGDRDVLSLWEQVKQNSLWHCDQVYRRLGVLLTDADVRGESAYNDDLPRVIADLTAKGLLTESQGAQCVFVKDAQGKDLFLAKDGSPLPFIVQKSDEGYLYATTDLAAIRYRCGTGPDAAPWGRADRILYVVDARQALHFRMLFAVAREAGFAPRDATLEHIAFGTMMGADGRPFKTREGGTVKLMALLDEAEQRALDLVTQKNAEDVAAGRAEPFSEEQRKDIARIVGIGAVKYADLSQNRTSDYVFTWDKMLSLQGNTAPYMQYAYARVRSIFRKGDHEAEAHRQDDAPIEVAAPAELALAGVILRFAETVDRAVEDYRPNILAAYLYDLAQAFTAFYDACPVLKSEPSVRIHRLKLCDLTARIMERGLGLLGIETADRM